MTIDVDTGDLPASGSEPVTQDLDTIITAAYDQFEGDSAPNADDAANTNTGAASDRDERGRFTRKNDAAADASEAGAPDAAADANAAAPVDPAPVQPVEPPARWSEAEKAEFAKLPPEGQKLVSERYKAMEADYTRKTQDIAEFRKQAEPLVQAVAPYQQYLETLAPHIGLAPAQLVQQVLGFEHRLRTGEPHEKAEVFQDLAATYGIDLRALANGEVAQPDPVINQLRQQVTGLTQRLSHYEQQTEAEHSRQVSSQIDTFANATDANGQPKHPHFSVVRAAMSQILASGQASSMEEAYALAAKPIEDRIAETLKARADEAEKQRQAALDKARKAAPVRSTGSQPAGTTKSTDLNSLLEQAIAQAGIS